MALKTIPVTIWERYKANFERFFHGGLVIGILIGFVLGVTFVYTFML